MSCQWPEPPFNLSERRCWSCGVARPNPSSTTTGLATKVQVPLCRYAVSTAQSRSLAGRIMWCVALHWLLSEVRGISVLPPVFQMAPTLPGKATKLCGVPGRKATRWLDDYFIFLSLFIFILNIYFLILSSFPPSVWYSSLGTSNKTYFIGSYTNNY